MDGRMGSLRGKAGAARVRGNECSSPVPGKMRKRGTASPRVGVGGREVADPRGDHPHLPAVIERILTAERRGPPQQLPS
eukprot:scaffold563_cov410-Prasinococcus_capsulatus_cf.AAC.12